MYLNSGLRVYVFEFRTTGSCILIPDYWVMYLNSDYRLEVITHPEGPATGQIDEGFPYMFSLLEQIQSLYPHFAFLN